MSWQSTQAVRDLSKSRGVARMVFMVIATHADEAGEDARLGIDTLARECQLDERQVTRHLNTLAEEYSDEITISRGLGRGNVYYFRIHLAGTKKPKEKVTLPVKNAKSDQIKGDTLGEIKGDTSGKKRTKTTNTPPLPCTPLPPMGGEANASLLVLQERSMSTDSVQNESAPSAEIIPVNKPVPEASSAIGYFLGASKQANGRTATLPNYEAAGSQAKRLAVKVGKDAFRSAVDLFFADEWYRANYGPAWGKFYQNFETILAKATVPQPLPPSRAAPRLSPVEERRQAGEKNLDGMLDGLKDKIRTSKEALPSLPATEGGELDGRRISAGEISRRLAGDEPIEDPDGSAGVGRNGPGALRGRIEAAPNHRSNRLDPSRDTPVVQILPHG